MNWLIRIVFAIAVISASVRSMAQQASAGTGTGRELPEAAVPSPQYGHVFVPESSIERPEDLGERAHTNYVFRSIDGNKPKGTSVPEPWSVNADQLVEEAETPASLGCLYVSSPHPRSTGCIPNSTGGTKGPSSAGWGAIALVDAYDNPDAASDLKTFDSFWGLPAAKFVKIYANGNGDCNTPPPNADWSVEESLDIEWAHVFAPKAVIVLVEACSSSNTDLDYAEGVAIDYIQNHYGGGEVSNSWGGSETSGEIKTDPMFAGWNYNYSVPVTTFASAGDNGCKPQYPSVSPWVVSVGGTSVLRNSDGSFNSESCWSGSGGGTSKYETWANSFGGGNMGGWAAYQYAIFGEAARQTPDIAADADPASGAWVYNQYSCGGWCVIGGTSLAAPSNAGIVNRANNRLSTWFGFAVDSQGFFYAGENTLLYSQLESATAYYKNFYDVTGGSNGCTVTASWDYCTGVGTPRDLLGK